MNLQVVLALVVGFPVGVDKKGDKVKQELKKLQGEWVQVYREANGRDFPPEVLEGVRMTIKGNRYTISELGDPAIEGTFTLDPTPKAKQIDDAGKYQGREFKSVGIYRFDGDKLTLCYTSQGKGRPKEFSTKGGTEQNPVILIVYQRAQKDK
jgi:uncharacterized protein (TIGR03067 family)